MTGLVIVGWAIITAVAFFFLLGGLALLIIGPKFNGKFCFEALFPLTIGGLTPHSRSQLESSYECC